MKDIELQPTLYIDAEVPLSSLNGNLFQGLNALQPSGVGNPPPVFLTRKPQIMETCFMGGQEQHLRLKLKEGKVIWDAVAFRQGENWSNDMKRVDVVYTLFADQRGSQRVLALKVLDFRPTDTQYQN